MFPTREKIDALAGRIEQAFHRRHPDLAPGRNLDGVWAAAATGLLMMRRTMPSVPIDPEMFVAVQPSKPWSDPWVALTEPNSFQRYRRHVRRIVSMLRSEIKGEIRHAVRQFRRGGTIVEALQAGGGKLSPLGRYVIARRLGLDDLAEQYRPEAERQHRSCPLYQQACRSLLPAELYPNPRETGLIPGMVIPAGHELPSFSAN